MGSGSRLSPEVKERAVRLVCGVPILSQRILSFVHLLVDLKLFDKEEPSVPSKAVP